MKFELFGKLRDEGEDSDGDKSLTDVVRELSNKGYSQQEITEGLRDKGYSYAEINQALNQVGLRGSQQGREKERSSPQTGSQAQAGRGMGQENQPSPKQTPQSQPSQPAPSPQPIEPDTGDQGGYEASEPESQPDPEESGEVGDLSFGVSQAEEELIETIVEEKMIDIEDEFENIYTQIDGMKEDLEKLKEDVKELKIRKDEEEKKYMQKVDELEEYLEQSDSRIAGLEKAFQQTLPNLVENVRDLTQLVQDMKKGRNQE